MILRKLHYERSRFTGKRFCFLKNDRCYKYSYDSDKVHQRSDKGALCISCGLTSNYTTHKSDNRKFCTTRNKCCCHDSKTSVIILLDGLGSHDSRDTASRRNKERNEALTGKSEVTEYTVHNKCDTYHVTTVFKDGQEQEQDRHLRNESKYCTKTTDDTVNYKSHYHIASADAAEDIACEVLNSYYEYIICPVCYECTNCCYRYIIY